LPEDGGDDNTRRNRNEGSPPLKDCDRRFINLESDVTVLNNAIFGPDGTNGLVKKVDKIEYQTGVVRFIGQGIFGIAISIITIILVKVFTI